MRLNDSYSELYYPSAERLLRDLTTRHGIDGYAISDEQPVRRSVKSVCFPEQEPLKKI